MYKSFIHVTQKLLLLFSNVYEFGDDYLLAWMLNDVWFNNKKIVKFQTYT